MANLHKCPFCLYSFTRNSAISFEVNEDITIYKCPNPREKNNRKLCNRELPLNFFDAESKVISIAGSRNVGKTYYLIALLLQIKNNKSFQRLGFSGQLIGEANSIKEINKMIDDINNGKVLGISKVYKGVEDMALVIDLTIKKGKANKHIFLSFFDTPGEGYTDRKYMYENFQCLYKADGLLFLIEPLQINYLIDEICSNNPYITDDNNPHNLQEVFYNVIDLLKYVQRNRKAILSTTVQTNSGSSASNMQQTATQEPVEHNEAEVVNEEVSTLFEEQPRNNWWTRLFNNSDRSSIQYDAVRCPIAVGVTKVDQLKQLLFNEIPYDYSDFESMYLKDDKINLDLIKDISEEIKDIVFNEVEGEIGVQNMLETEMKSYEFFGIKSGDVNEINGEIEHMKEPQGVLLPLIWLLIKLKLY